MRACRKYVFVTVSSKVRASLRSSVTRGLAGCTFHLQECVSLGLLMLADDPPHGEDARATVLAGPGGLADVREVVRSRFDGTHDVAVAHGRALTDDHVAKVRLTSAP